MKTRRIILALALALLLTLPACGRRTLDAETQALAEECDALCMGKAVEREMIPYPEGTDLNLLCVERADGSRWAVLVKLRLTADFFGNLTYKGTGAGRSAYRYIYVLADPDWACRPMPSHGKPERILFLDIVPGLTHRDFYEGAEEDCPVFTPHSPEGVQWRTDDARGIRFIEALRACGSRSRHEAQ